MWIYGGTPQRCLSFWNHSVPSTSSCGLTSNGHSMHSSNSPASEPRKFLYCGARLMWTVRQAERRAQGHHSSTIWPWFSKKKNGQGRDNVDWLKIGFTPSTTIASKPRQPAVRRNLHGQLYIYQEAENAGATEAHTVDPCQHRREGCAIHN